MKSLRWIAALLVLTVGVARAAGEMEEAKRHFAQGVALYNDGNYNAALAEFEAAYKLKKSPGVLYNIGLTQKALFRYNEAIASLTEYQQLEKKLTPERKSEIKNLISEMQALLATVTFNVTPEGATILLDGRTLGQAPLKPQGIAAGNHVIEATADGYKPGRKELIVSAGVPVTVNLALEVIPKSGRAHIASNQPMSSIKIDDKDMGMAPLDVELPLGGHTLEVSAKGYQPYRSELVVAGGQMRTVNVILELPPSPAKEKFYKKWYFWVPVAVVVAGAVAVGVAVPLTQKPSPLVGTLDPGAQPVN
jgi:hypothetical protein